MNSKMIALCALLTLAGCESAPVSSSEKDVSEPYYYYGEDPWTGPGWYEGVYYSNEKDFRRHYGGHPSDSGRMQNRSGRGGRGSNWTN